MKKTQPQAATLLVLLATALVALLWPASAVAERACTSADIARIFTTCDARTSNLTVVSYVDPSAACDAAGLVVPPPRSLGCYACADGQQLDAATLECTACPTGTVGSSTTRFNVFDPFPAEISTYCDPEPCAPWTAVEDTYGTVLSSGLQPTEGRPITAWGTVDESVQSLLFFTATVTGSDGVLLFDYSISSEEGYDGLVVRLNSTAAKNPDLVLGKRGFFATGVHLDWYTASLPLPRGTTRVQFEYTKDSSGPVYGAELTGVNDRALLRNIVVKGTHKSVAELQCVPCPPGHWTNTAGGTGAAECERCPRNTFRGAADTGCQACPAGSSAPEGSTSCAATRDCTAADYTAQYGACESDGKRTRSWTKYPGATCLDTTGTQPQPSRVECAACPPGTRRKDGKPTDACVPCAAGEVLSWAGTCAACPVGSAAVPVLAYRDGFDGLGGSVGKLAGSSMSLRYCSGASASCLLAQGQGFEVVALPFSDEDNTVMGIRQTHLSNATYALSTFNYTFNAAEDGTANITFAYVDATGAFVDHLDARTTLNVHLMVDEEEDYAVRTYAARPRGSASPFLSMLVPFFVDTAMSGKQHRLTWVVEELAATSNPISVVIVALEVTGDTAGGAVECQPCRPGHQCPAKASAMVPCPPGTAQGSSKQGTCNACVNRGFAPGYGFTSCVSCPTDMTLSDDHTECKYNCAWTQGGSVYNFTALRGVVLNVSVSPTTGGNATASLSVEEADEAGIARWYFSPCDPLPVPDAATATSAAPGPVTRERLCVPERRSRNSSTSAYVCQRTSATRGHHYGGVLTHLTFVNPYIITEQGSPYATDNTTSPTTARYASDMRDSYEAVLALSCDMDRSKPREGSLRHISDSAGLVFLEWRTSYACPQCTESSYERVETGCEDNATQGAGGTRRIYYTLRADTPDCFGGYEPPAPVITYCRECTSSAYAVRWLECNETSQTQEGVYVLKEGANCTPGAAAQPPVKPRACSANEKSSSGTLIMTLIILLGMVVAALFVLGTYYRRLRERVARAARGEAAELDTYGVVGPNDLYVHYNTDENEEAPGAAGAGAAGADASTRTGASAAASRLWGVVMGMGNHLRPTVTLHDVIDDDTEAGATPRNANGYNRVSNSADPSAAQRGGGRRQNMFALADDDDNLLPNAL